MNFTDAFKTPALNWFGGYNKRQRTGYKKTPPEKAAFFVILECRDQRFEN